jgi:hypothetical protein
VLVLPWPLYEAAIPPSPPSPPPPQPLTPHPPQYQLINPTYAIKDAAEKLKAREALAAGAMKDKLVKLAEMTVGAR